LLVIKGWTLAAARDDARIAWSGAAAGRGLQRFGRVNGTVAFDAPEAPRHHHVPRGRGGVDAIILLRYFSNETILE
jgi:hypothetical protein